jgi:site-specific DNA-methyltransferase (adenine-specific)
MEDKKASLVLLDPPYGVDYVGKNNRLTYDNDNKDEASYTDLISGILKTTNEVLVKNGVFYMFHSHTQQLVILEQLREHGFKVMALIIWIKNHATFTGYLNATAFVHYRQKHEPIYYCRRENDKHSEIVWYGGYDQVTTWEYDRTPEFKEHPTSKPIDLYAKPIRNSSKEEEIVFDPTLGSGSTLIACEQTNRICYGVEIDPHYVDVCVKRWEAYTEQKAVKLIKNEKEELGQIPQ